MSARNPDALSAVVARQRGRARLRAASLVIGAASLVGAGVVAYHLPGTAQTGSSQVAGTAAASSGSAAVHTTSGGSGVAASVSGTAGSASAPAASSGRSHVTSGGS